MTSLKPPTLPLTRGCPCGAVRFAVREMPYLAYACHCTNCQRASGSAFALNMPVAKPALKITQGQPKASHRTSPSGVPGTFWFCGDCGGRIYGERASAPDIAVLRGGTLDDTSWVTPVAHFFMRSAQPWERFDTADATCFEAGSDDYAPLVAIWRQRYGL
ncbi:GFA family protein [Reyranella sp.]|uniref:GFA family protein n=1 Tax=Reyranella sp. TaxID=1929291 RepID=UPI003D0F4E8C